MPEIREIGEDELDPFVEVLDAAFPREDPTAEGFVDWKRQAEDMAWFLAEDGGAFVLVGWHTPPGHAIGGIGVRPDSQRGRPLSLEKSSFSNVLRRRSKRL